MKTSKLQTVNTHYNPLDVIEDIVICNNWEYERDSNENIHVEVGGEWCDYQLSFGINDEYNLLYISCVLDMNIPDYRFKEMYSFIASLNEKLLIGHFEIWTDESWPVLKQSFPMPNNHSLCRNQLEQATLLALKECEKFYPAFQLFAWDNKDVNSTLQHLMLETQGEV
ncbi:MAG: hypothetical protein CBC22_06775 [Alphaproteobacteria bacterium TMED62]|nr:MAG: hypothetical protein CBC22_06775 [Alphaproteobacteria bacterium TMED62]|tara:strand:- start:3474 stop:3977 length:504 start_codon:yes stop_codon:yes gene_type:complete